MKEKAEKRKQDIEKLQDRQKILSRRLSEMDGRTEKRKVREYNRVKIHDSFAVMKLTPELMDEYVERVEVHPNNEISVIWK